MTDDFDEMDEFGRRRRRPTELRNLRLRKIDRVDAGAQPGARVALIKHRDVDLAKRYVRTLDEIREQMPDADDATIRDARATDVRRAVAAWRDRSVQYLRALGLPKLAAEALISRSFQRYREDATDGLDGSLAAVLAEEGGDVVDRARSPARAAEVVDTIVAFEKERSMPLSQADVHAAIERAAVAKTKGGISLAQARKRVLDEYPALYSLCKRLPKGDASIAKSAPLDIRDVVALAKQQLETAIASLKRISEVAHLVAPRARADSVGETFGVASLSVLRNDAQLSRLVAVVREYPSEAALPFPQAVAALTLWVPDINELVLDVMHRPDVAAELAVTVRKGMR